MSVCPSALSRMNCLTCLFTIIFVYVSKSITKKDLGAKGLYNGGPREVRERSGVFYISYGRI